MTLPEPITYATPIFVILILAEMLFARVSNRVTYEARDMAASLAMGLGNGATRVFLGFTTAWAYGLAQQNALFAIGFPVWAFVACFFLEDFAYYWFHRCSHEVRWFWAAHVTHHSSQHYNLSTALRQPWTGRLAFTYIFWLPLVFVGFPPEMVFFFSGLNLVYQFWIHTEVIDRMGPFEWIFNTPSHHRVHHGVNPRYLDANYAGIFIVWDRMFGTFVPEDRADPPRYGIIKPLATFNPVTIAFHEWADMARDVLAAKSIKEAAMRLIGPPGWSPDGSTKTAKQLKQEWRKVHAPHDRDQSVPQSKHA